MQYRLDADIYIQGTLVIRFDKQISPKLIEVQVYLRLWLDTQNVLFAILIKNITICSSGFNLSSYAAYKISKEADGGLKA